MTAIVILKLIALVAILACIVCGVQYYLFGTGPFVPSVYYSYKGTTYKYIKQCKVKGEDGSWYHAVMYTNKRGEVFIRKVSDFYAKFKKV